MSKTVFIQLTEGGSCDVFSDDGLVARMRFCYERDALVVTPYADSQVFVVTDELSDLAFTVKPLLQDTEVEK